jgi:hypothetical protein
MAWDYIYRRIRIEIIGLSLGRQIFINSWLIMLPGEGGTLKIKMNNQICGDRAMVNTATFSKIIA